MEKAKKLVEELKQIRLDMYRNAGELDRFIQYLEDEMEKDYEFPKDSNIWKIFVQYQYRNRMDQKQVCNYHSLNAREDSVWARLILEADPDRVIEEQES